LIFHNNLSILQKITKTGTQKANFKLDFPSMSAEKIKKRFWNRLNNRYRLVLLNDETFEENISFKMTPLSLITIIFAITIVGITLIISLIAFTPLKEYIPGYADVNLRRDLLKVAGRTDSMQMALKEKTLFVNDVQSILQGKTVSTAKTKVEKDSTKDYSKVSMLASSKEEKMRKQIENQALYSLNTSEIEGSGALAEVFFFTPIKGAITTAYNLKNKHLGIDIAAPENEIVKNVLDGTVILSEYSAESGYVVYVQHTNNIISVYKHNSQVLIKQGEYVKSGAPIAIVGNTGENSNGTHLHFELWHDGHAVNPQDYIIF
jgi:murein DD-endopeptidase MepM/ murein hydrolase activator NlpD